MKKFVILFLLLMIPTLVSAHGGVEKNVDSVVVSLNQDPLSPLVGENVKMYFSLKDQGIQEKYNLSEQNLKNWPITLKLIDTYYGDQSKDITVLTKNITTDSNGNFEFDYTFLKANYYDLELTFRDHNGTDQTTGFLIQTRNVDILNAIKLWVKQLF